MERRHETLSAAGHLKLYACTLAAFFAIDIVWLGVVARDFYREHLGFLLRSRIDWTAAVSFYLLWVFALLVFVVVPGLKAGSSKQVLLRGALFGLVTYATFDLTNQAMIRDWPLVVTLVDLAWGSALAASVAYVGFRVGQRLR